MACGNVTGPPRGNSWGGPQWDHGPWEIIWPQGKSRDPGEQCKFNGKHVAPVGKSLWALQGNHVAPSGNHLAPGEITGPLMEITALRENHAVLKGNHMATLGSGFRGIHWPQGKSRGTQWKSRGPQLKSQACKKSRISGHLGSPGEIYVGSQESMSFHGENTWAPRTTQPQGNHYP